MARQKINCVIVCNFFLPRRIPDTHAAPRQHKEAKANVQEVAAMDAVPSHEVAQRREAREDAHAAAQE
jgi:hypothetical protein